MQSHFEGTAVEVADSIPRLYPCGDRLRRQARCSSAGRGRTKKRVRAAWPRPAKSRRPQAGNVREAADPEEITAQCTEKSWRSRDRKPPFKRFLACCITLKLSRSRRRSARATSYAEPGRRHCGGGGRQHTEAVPMWRSAEAASALFFCGPRADQEESTSSLAKTGEITAAAGWQCAGSRRPRGNHGAMYREIVAVARPKTALQAFLSLLHNVKVSGRRRRSAPMTGCAEPPRRHCRGTGPQHIEAVPTRRTPEAPSALFACPLAAQDETEHKRPCSARQHHGGQGLTELELRPTRTSAMRIPPRDRGERRTEGESSCVA